MSGEGGGHGYIGTRLCLLSYFLMKASTPPSHDTYSYSTNHAQALGQLARALDKGFEEEREGGQTDCSLTRWNSAMHSAREASSPRAVRYASK